MSLSLDQIEDRAQQALSYLSDTDEKVARLKFEAAKAEHVHQKTVDAHYLTLDGPVEARKAQARTDSEAQYLAYLEAELALNTVQNKRKHEELVVDWLRSLYSARKQGL